MSTMPLTPMPPYYYESPYYFHGSQVKCKTTWLHLECVCSTSYTSCVGETSKCVNAFLDIIRKLTFEGT